MRYFVANVVLFFLLVGVLFAQHSDPAVIQAVKISEKLKFDGILNDSIWQAIPHISNFTQRELNYGEPASERTEVAVAYDKNSLYIGIWCYQQAEIVAKYMTPDFDYESDDNFQIMLSPFDDNRTGYLFAINPNGARADILISGGEDGNEDWNGVWDAKTTVTAAGWFAEVVIPFSTLQFKTDSVLNWALNFERDVVSRNEQSLWQAWSRDNSIFSVVNAGKLLNLRNIAYAKRFELKPYLLAGRHFEKGDDVSYPFKIGGDLTVNISPTLKLNLSSYTDFAQVESDRIPVNLSRFGIYFPEKRQFFLDGYDFYSFYLGDRNHAFYSRQLGSMNGGEVPIVAGARLFGKIGRNDIGFLHIVEGKTDETPAVNNTVFRYKRNVGRQSYVGGIFTNLYDGEQSSQLLGVDASYQSSTFLKHKNISIRGTVSTTMRDFSLQENSLSYRLSVDYPNDLVDNFMAIGSMQKNFDPKLGYLRRSNYNSYSWYLRISPRVLSSYGVKRLVLKPWGFTAYQTRSSGELESFSNETRPFGAVLKSGDRFEFNFIQNYDRLDAVFELTEAVVIPQGKYMMYAYEFQLESYQARRMWLALRYRWGDFYSGRIKTFEAETGLNVNKYFNVNVSYSANWLSFTEEDIVTNELTAYLNLAPNPRLSFSLFAQYNDLDEIMIYNIRLHWIPRIGSDFYFVYNIGYNEPLKQIEYLKPQTSDAALKLVYRITF